MSIARAGSDNTSCVKIRSIRRRRYPHRDDNANERTRRPASRTRRKRQHVWLPLGVFRNTGALTNAHVFILTDAQPSDKSPRRRDILLASRLEGISLRDIAGRHGISQRMVEIELKYALMHCGRRMGRKIVQRFGPRRREGSLDEDSLE